MIDPNALRVAIIMVNRAPCKGGEAQDVATCLSMLEAEYNRLTTPTPALHPVETPDLEEV